MKNLFFGILALCFFNVIKTYSQVTIDKFPGFVTFDDQLIRVALDSAFVVVRQDYVLKSTNPKNPKEFGRGGNAYFGRVYGVAVISGNKLWADGRLKTPWLYDEHYKDYESADSLRPVLTNLYIRRISEKNFRKVSLELADTNKSDFFYYNAKKMDFRGIPEITTAKDSNGWVVIAYSKEDMTINDSCDVFLFSFRPKPQFKNNSFAAVKMVQKENILGGGYFSANITVGIIRFNLTGMLYRKNSGWLVSVLPAVEKNDLNEIKKEVKEQKKDKKAKN